MSRREKLAWLALGLLALVSRFLFLGERVPHHDEAVHAHLARELLLLGKYQYDPTYHGPLQFYVLAPLMALFGQNDLVARSWAAACGVALALVPMLLRRRLGAGAALGTGLLILLSPTLTYYSRFARNEGPVALFTLAAVALLLSGQRSHRFPLVAVAVLAALHLASKETFYIYLAVMGAALGATLLCYPHQAFRSLKTWLSRQRAHLAAAAAVFFALSITLYTFFFRYPEDVLFPFKAFSYWWGQHAQERVAGPWWYYLPRLGLYEAPVVALGSWFFWRRRRRLSPTWFFLCLWGLFSVGMYAYLGEKVPWLLVHQILPWLPAAGAALSHTFGPQGSRGQRLCASLLLVASTWNSLQSSFVHPAIEPSTGKAELLVYVQTVPSFQRIIEEGRRLAHESRGEMVIAVEGEAGWPLAWSWANLPVWWDKPQADHSIKLFLCDPGHEQEIVNTLGKSFGCEEIPLRAWWVEEGPVNVRGLLQWFTTRKAWSPLGFQSVMVCRQVPEPAS